jgi:low temperature requirement protein LtrA
MSDPVTRSRGRMWQRPALRDDGDRHRPVGWVELFFDLVFVVIIAVLAADLQSHFDIGGMLRFVIEFIAVVWVWNSFTYYTERFESWGLEGRLFVFLAILAVAGLAVWGEDGLGRNYLGFATCYVLARLLNIILWLRAGLYVPTFRRAALGFTGGFIVATGLLGVSLAVNAHFRIVVCALAVGVDIATPALTSRFQDGLPPISRDKFPERFGLFTMIVLGQTIAGVISGVATENQHASATVATAIAAALGIAIGFGMWWVYFDFIARRPPRRLFSAALIWVYVHILALTAMVIVGAGISGALAEVGRGALSTAVQRGLLLSVAATLIAVALLETTLDRSRDEPTHSLVSPGIKILAAVALVVLVLVNIPLTAMAGLGIALGSLAVPAAYGAIVWFSPRAATSQSDP